MKPQRQFKYIFNDFAAKDCNLTNKQLQTEQNEAKSHISFDVCQ